MDDVEMPCTPQRVWRAINGAGARSGAAGQADEPSQHWEQPVQSGGVQ